jgi:hypothetical protein
LDPPAADDRTVRAPARIAAAALAGLALASPAAASASTAEQVAWVRRAADRFVAAELAHNGAEACAVLAAPLRATIHGRSCAQRWDGRIAALLSRPHARARLRDERRAIASARVRVHGYRATIALPAPLLGSSSTFVWTEMCWMLER